MRRTPIRFQPMVYQLIIAVWRLATKTPFAFVLIGFLWGCSHGGRAEGASAGRDGTGGRTGTGGAIGAGGSAGGERDGGEEGGAAAGAGGTGDSLGSGGNSLGTGGSLGNGGNRDAGDRDSAGGEAGAGGTTAARSLADLQREYIDLRFGMFLHFGILTFCGSQPGDPCPGNWSQPNLDIAKFSPSDLYDPRQWADAAVSAKMRFGILTTRHHDGFALWPSAAGTFNVKSIPWKNGQGDVVRDYVDAFRSRGLLPGLYYSIWDNTEGIGNGPIIGRFATQATITPAQFAYVKTQITELLTNYGPIPILVIDGWSWRMGHKAVAYQEIRELVKSLQPDCLLTDHTHLIDPWNVDIVNFEEPAGAFVPPSNTYAAEQGTKINASGGNDWFWAPNIGNLMSVSQIVDGHLRMLEPRWTSFILNCPPNRNGLLDPAIVSRLAEVGAAWSPNLSRPPLPVQDRIIDHPYTPVSATATSGNAAAAIDGINDTTLHTAWQTAGTLPQSITLDLGQVRPDVGLLAYVPQYTTTGGAEVGISAGAITSFRILVSTDGTTFGEAANGTWTADGKMKTAVFGPVPARYVRLEALAAMGPSAMVTEITVGANRP
jgi:alpha-L-fucosidase